AGVGRRAGRRCAPQGSAAGIARRAGLRIPPRGDRSLGQGPAVRAGAVVGAWGRARRAWGASWEWSRPEPVHAAIEAGLAVAPLLRSSVPERFEILGRPARLPALPGVPINTYLPP